MFCVIKLLLILNKSISHYQKCFGVDLKLEQICLISNIYIWKFFFYPPPPWKEKTPKKSNKTVLLLLIPILIEIAYVCDLDWPTILMKGNTLERVRVARFGLIDKFYFLMINSIIPFVNQQLILFFINIYKLKRLVRARLGLISLPVKE